MTFCLMAPTHYLNQYGPDSNKPLTGPILTKVHDFLNVVDINYCINTIEYNVVKTKIPGTNEFCIMSLVIKVTFYK